MGGGSGARFQMDLLFHSFFLFGGGRRGRGRGRGWRIQGDQKMKLTSPTPFFVCAMEEGQKRVRRIKGNQKKGRGGTFPKSSAQDPPRETLTCSTPFFVCARRRRRGGACGRRKGRWEGEICGGMTNNNSSAGLKKINK